MNDRIYRAVIGVLILLALYFDSGPFIYFIVCLMFIEGATNWRLPKLLCFLCKCVTSSVNDFEYIVDAGAPNYRFKFESERVWRFFVAFFLSLGWLLYEQLWFFPWFLGFAIFGAGLSGVCPMLLAIRWIGFR